MISYELVKKLKDAGFPVEKGLKENWHGQTIFFDGETNDDSQKVYFNVPTLSELIKACGSQFGILDYYHSEKWGAYAKERGVSGMGDTPEEAVAYLWLMLAKKL